MPVLDVSSERFAMARAATLLLLAGSAIGVVMMLLPHSAEINQYAYDAIAALGLIGAGIVWWARAWLPASAYHLVSAFGILLVSASIYYSGNDTGGAAENELIYLWPVLFAGYFFGRRGMAVQLAIIGVAYAGVLFAMDSGQEAIARWAGTIGTLIAAGVFVRFLREQLDQDISLRQATLDSTTDGILVVDGKGRWISFNRRFLDMWRIPTKITSSRDDDAAIEFVLDQLADPGAFVAKIRELYETPDAESHDELLFKDGRVFDRYSQPQKIEGRSIGRVWSFRDVTEQKRSEERLQHLADHDPLTDLLNRRRFEDELDREGERSVRYRTGGALLLMDLDNFKGVNDGHGHIWGDEVLRGVARVLGARVRSTDVLARLGGDEFAVLLPEADQVRAVKLAEELLEVLRAHPVETDNGTITVTPSIGVVTLDAVRDSGLEPMVAADTAMYRAKAEGRDRLAVYEPGRDSSGPEHAPRARTQPGDD